MGGKDQTKKIRCEVGEAGITFIDQRGIFLIWLTPKEAFELQAGIRDALFKWSALTGKKIDEENPH